MTADLSCECVNGDGTLTLTPTDLFDEKALLAVPAVKQKIEVTGREAARNVTEKATLEIDKLTADNTRQANELDSLRITANAAKRGDLFAGLATERKLTDSQKAFMEKNLGAFETKETDDLKIKADLITWADSQLVEYRDMAKLMGVEPAPDEKVPTPKGDDIEPGADLSTKESGNPMIPK